MVAIKWILLIPACLGCLTIGSALAGTLAGLVAPQFYVNLFNAFFGAFSAVLAAYFFAPSHARRVQVYAFAALLLFSLMGLMGAFLTEAGEVANYSVLEKLLFPMAEVAGMTAAIFLTQPIKSAFRK